MRGKAQHVDGLEEAGLVPWAGGPPGASFGFYTRSIPKPNPYRKILYKLQRESLGTDIL